MSSRDGNKLLGKKREVRENDEVSQYLKKYKEESEEEQTTLKETQNKNETNKVSINVPSIKTIKLNFKEIRSSDKGKPPRKQEEEAPQSAPFNLQEETKNEPEVREEQPEEHNGNEVKENGNKERKEDLKTEEKEKETEKSEKKDIFNSLFSKPSTEGGSLFSGSLFSSNANQNSLFGSNAGSSLPNLFSNINSLPGSGLFTFSNTGNQSNNFFNFSKKNESDEEGDDGEDEKEEKRSESPEVYRPTTEKTNGPYIKKYVKLVEAFFVYNKNDKKYMSKGDGYLSIEYTEEPKKSAVFVFRYLFRVI
jgi:hypothetical protein